MLYEALVRAFGIGGANFNAQSGLAKFGGRGATCQLDQLSEPKDLAKHWGKNYSLIIADEVGEHNGMDLVDKLRASLRPPLGIPARMVLIGNPGGRNHAALLKRYVAGVTPWTPTLDAKSGRHFIFCPSTYRDNPHINQAEYVAQLKAACANDPELLKAWLDGSWAVAKGGFFASCIAEARNMTEVWEKIPDGWETYLAHDFGSSAPSCTFVCAKSPGEKGPDGRWYARDSIILVDEWATNRPDSLTEGMGYTVPTLAEQILDMAKRWKMKRAEGCADDSIFARTGSGAGSIAEEFTRGKVYFRSARKADRISGWATMKRLLADAGKPDVPALYISRCCEYFWQTVPFLARDPRRVEDVDSRGPDHAADAARYACLYRKAKTTVTPFPF
jgi:hypothetical protein